jgi:DNA-directed RNA polymerase subunit M/transcription elongation factor TFIIS|tara:strand:+ start:992 stop:1330 length:339 start_codon:yes stop_codon:yes gene_type:complete
MFCDVCGTLGYYLLGGGLECKSCDTTDAAVKEIVLSTGERVDIKKALVTSTGEPELRIFEVIERLKMPTTDTYHCPKCEARESTCELRQMDQTDEPEVAFLQCQVCWHGWRI